MKTSCFWGLTVRLFPVRFSLLQLLASSVLLFLSTLANASIRNGNFTNNAAGWVVEGSGAGGPRVVTNGSTIAVQIGTNSTAGVAGVPGGALIQEDFRCDPSGNGPWCVVSFTAAFTKAPGDRAIVTISSPNGSTSRIIPEGGPAAQSISLPLTCQFGTKIIFKIVPARPNDPANSLLEISDVSSFCSGVHNDTMSIYEAAYLDPLRQYYELSENMNKTGSGFVILPPGYTPFVITYLNGSNLLDNVVHAQTNSEVFKWDPLSNTWQTYLRIGVNWQPPGGTLRPGDAAFFYNPLTNSQGLTYIGTSAPLPFNTHPSSGSNFFGNGQPVAAPISEVIGTPVIVGDVLKFYTSTTSSFLVPQWVYTVDATTIENLPLVPAGGVVEADWAAPSSVALTAGIGAGFGTNGVTIRVPGGLPPGGLLQKAENFAGIWQSLYGVSDFYQDAGDTNNRFFRMDFTPPTNQINLHVVGADGVKPVAGMVFQEDPNGTVSATDTNGNASFPDVSIGTTAINSFFDVFTEINAETNKESEPLPFVVNVDTNLTQIPVNIKIDPNGTVVFLVGLTNCTCAPWAGVLGGTINGVQKVVAGGGATPKGCVDLGTTHVTIMGPGGINVDLGSGGRQTFEPAANGTWTVTATVCGITKTAAITLP